MEGISAAFVDNNIMLLMDNGNPLDEAAIKAALEPFKSMKLGQIQKADQLPF